MSNYVKWGLLKTFSTHVKALKEIARLQALVKELTPFMREDVKAALEMGPASNDHSRDDCDDCLWYERALEWERRINKGELNV